MWLPPFDKCLKIKGVFYSAFLPSHNIFLPSLSNGESTLVTMNQSFAILVLIYVTGLSKNLQISVNGRNRSQDRDWELYRKVRNMGR